MWIETKFGTAVNLGRVVKLATESSMATSTTSTVDQKTGETTSKRESIVEWTVRAYTDWVDDYGVIATVPDHAAGLQMIRAILEANQSSASSTYRVQ